MISGYGEVVRRDKENSALYEEFKYAGARDRRSIGHVWPPVQSKMSMRFCYRRESKYDAASEDNHVAMPNTSVQYFLSDHFGSSRVDVFPT